MGRPQNRLPREAAGTAPLEMFNTRLDLGFGLVERVSAYGKGWDKLIFKVPTNPNNSMIL